MQPTQQYSVQSQCVAWIQRKLVLFKQSVELSVKPLSFWANCICGHPNCMTPTVKERKFVRNEKGDVFLLSMERSIVPWSIEIN